MILVLMLLVSLLLGLWSGCWVVARLPILLRVFRSLVQGLYPCAWAGVPGCGLGEVCFYVGPWSSPDSPACGFLVCYFGLASLLAGASGRLITSLWSAPLLGFWIMVAFPPLCHLVTMEILLPLSSI